MSDTTDHCSDAGTGGTRGPESPRLDADRVDGEGTTEPDGETFCGRVERYDDEPDECTIFPEKATAELPRLTTWVTAREGSYLSLEDAR